MRQAMTMPAHGGTYATLPRMVSLVLAIAMAGLILTYPRAFAHTGHGLLTLVMLGVSAGFVHGVGFIPEHKVWRILFGPWLAWPLLAAGLLLFLRG
jgi:cyd operon protein YbgE